MAHLTCRCGQRISLNSSPDPNQGQLLWEDAKEQWQASYKAKLTTGTAVQDVLDDSDVFSLPVIRCYTCQRIYIAIDHEETRYNCYRLEGSAE